MTAKVVVTILAVGVAAYAIRSLWDEPQAAGKIGAALIAIGAVAYGIALVVADGSC